MKRKMLKSVHNMISRSCWTESNTYQKLLVSDGYDTAQETSNNQQYG